MKIKKSTLKEIIVEEINIVLSELNACHDKKTGKLSSCKSGDSYSLSLPAVKSVNHDPDRAGKGKITSKGKVSYRFGMADGDKACGRKTVSGKKINPKYKCAEYSDTYDESLRDLVPSIDDAESDRKDKLGYSKHLQALGRGVIRADEDNSDQDIVIKISDLIDMVVDAFDQDELKESEMTPEQRRAAGERCKQLGYLTASEAQKRLLIAINNFNRASAGKLLEPNKA